LRKSQYIQGIASAEKGAVQARQKRHDENGSGNREGDS
jgi:hypothetical protein